MACDKETFPSFNSAKRRLRLWQRKGRRAAFDTLRPYQCPRCRMVHLGHADEGEGEMAFGKISKRWVAERSKRKERQRTRREIRQEAREVAIGEFETWCAEQARRVKRTLNPPQPKASADELFLRKPNTDVAEDVIHVERRS